MKTLLLSIVLCWSAVSAAHGVQGDVLAGEPLSPVERSAVEQLGEAFATHYPLRDGWYKGRAVQWYDLGRTEPQAGTLYRVRGGGEVFSTIPGVGGYSVVRRVYEVEVVAGGVEPVAVRSAAVIRALARRGQVRVVGTGQMVLAVVVPAGSTLEHDPAGRRLRPAWYRGVAVWYWGFGPARAAAQDAVWGGGEAAVLLTRVPGEAGYTDLCAVWAGEWGGRAYRDAQRALADGRAGRVVVRRRGQVRACPVMYVDGAPAARAERVAPQQPAVAAPTNGPSLAATGAAGIGAGAVFSGRSGQLAVPLPRHEAAVVVNGVLDEAAWGAAAHLTGFSQYNPQDGLPADDSTDVLVWYGADAIYFGIRAFAPPGAVRATLADRDKIGSDDYVQILLDTFNDRRRALVFAVNPLGAQADGTRSEGVQIRQGGSRFLPTTGGIPDVDLSQDFVFDSKGRITENGYEIEVKIPFKSIRFQSTDTQDWGINIVRQVQYSGHQQTWTPARKANASFLSQSGTFSGLTGFTRALILDINPVFTARMDGEPALVGGAWEYQDPDPELGGNVRWGVTPNLTLNGTVNPDFSQVEADVGQVSGNQRFAFFFPEKRPFFLEGAEQFDTPNRLIHTRQIVEPVGGVKVGGKVGNWNVGLLSAVDGKLTSADETDYPIFNLLRLRRDLGSRSWAGLLYTDKIDGNNYNRVAAADVRVVLGKLYSLQLQGGGSITRTAGVTTRAPLWEVAFNRAGRQFGMNYRVAGFHPDFETQSGFVPRTNVVQASLTNGVTWFGKPGATVESWTTSVRLSGNWLYRGFWNADPPLESRTFFINNFTLKGGWRGRISVNWETNDWDPARYADYAIQRLVGSATDTIPFPLPPRANDGVGVTSRFNTPEFGRFSASLAVNRLHDVGYIEATKVNLLRVTAELTWRPTDKLRINPRFTQLILDRRRDGTNLSTSRIPRLKVEYQLSRSIFVRFVGEYTAEIQDALRDPVTEAPILRFDSGIGDYVLTTREVSNGVRYDWLFSFRPNPGTVLFVGYGSSLTERDAFRFRDLERTADGFFVKLSYLFRG